MSGRCPECGFSMAWFLVLVGLFILIVVVAAIAFIWLFASTHAQGVPA